MSERAVKSYYKLSLSTAVRKSLPSRGFEISDRQIEKLKGYGQVVLAVLSVLGLATVAVLAPNALQALDIFQKRKGRRKFTPHEKQQKLLRAIYYLKDRNYVEFQRRGDDYEVLLTKEGKKQVRKLRLESLTVAKPKSWDGKFWQVAADIPTKKYRRGADALRAKLKQMNFYPLQRTLWFYPFDPRIEVAFVAKWYGIGSFVTVMKIEELDPADEQVLRRFFKEEQII